MMTRLLITTLLVVLVPTWSMADCVSIHEEDIAEMEWRILEEDQYTLCYHIDYIEDTFIATDWIDNAFEVGLEKYKVAPPVRRRGYDLNITIFLLPVPTSRANSSTATVICCNDRESLEIFIMTPSSPHYGRPVDDFIKTLTHEMMNTLHYETRESPNISPPLWILEGLAEYEGYFSTTPGNQKKVSWLLNHVHENLRDKIIYGRTLKDNSPTLISMDRYHGSAAIMAYLAEKFGDDIHYSLFTDSIDKILRDYGSSGERVFQELNSWLTNRRNQVSEVDYSPRMACTGRYWYRDNGTVSFEAIVLNNNQRPADHLYLQHQYRVNQSYEWTLDGFAIVSGDSSGFSVPLFTDLSSRPFEWQARSCADTYGVECSKWSNIVYWTVSSCANQELSWQFSF